MPKLTVAGITRNGPGGGMRQAAAIIHRMRTHSRKPNVETYSGMVHVANVDACSEDAGCVREGIEALGMCVFVCMHVCMCVYMHEDVCVKE